MKRIFLFLVLMSVTAVNAASQSVTLTQSQAWDIVKQQILENDLSNVNVYVSDAIVNANSEIEVLLKNEMSPNFSSWFFFIDDKPFESWEHECRYVFVNAATGKYEVQNKRRPPLFEHMKSLVTPKVTSLQAELFNFDELANMKFTASTATHDYAVIISGGMNRESNWERYWNDCSAIYSTLINVYGYPKDHIYVLISDGADSGADRHMNNGSYASSPQDLDGDGIRDINYAATRANVSKVFTELGSKLTQNDNLFIFTTDHGGQGSGTTVYMCLWNNEIMYDYEFANELNKVNAGKISICMEQCNSGGFIDNLQKTNRVIATACRYDQSSYAMSDLKYNEFAYHWISAVTGTTPTGTAVNADTNNDGHISMYEAFQYASKNDTKSETPQYSSSPSDLGGGLYLAQVFASEGMDIVGKTVNCNSETYYVNNLPSGMTVVWSKENATGAYSIETDSPQANQCTVSRMSYPMYYSMKLIAKVYDGSNIFAVLEKDIYGKPSTFNGTYNQEACTYYGVNHPEIKNTSAYENIAIYVHQGCIAKIKSPHFAGMNITHTGMNPDYFYYDKENTVKFSFPLNSGGAPMHINGTCDNSLANFSLLVFAISGNQNISKSLTVKAASVGYELSLPDYGVQGGDNNTDESWTLEVYNLQQGNKVCGKRVTDTTYNLDTTGWRQGVYVIKAQKRNNIYTGKINVK